MANTTPSPPTDAQKLDAVLQQNAQLAAENLRLKIGTAMQSMGLMQELLPYWQRDLKKLEEQLGGQNAR